MATDNTLRLSHTIEHHSELKSPFYYSSDLLHEAEMTNERLILLRVDQENFLHSVSHDLRGPVNNIEGISELLKESLEKEDIVEIKALMGYMQHSVKSMGSMIHELTQERKSQVNCAEPAETVNLQTLLEEVIVLLQSTEFFKDNIIASTFNVKEVIYNKKDLRTILYSLFANAMKHASILTEISVSSVKVGQYIEISIRDNGKGIEKEMQDNLLSRHAPLGNRMGSSTGLSIFILNKLLESTGGKIAIKSIPGQGCEFKISLKIQ
jgi:signal transduction histidine kinase